MTRRLVWSAVATLVVATALIPSREVRLAADQQTPGPAAAAVTFNKDIAPLVFLECAMCHHPGGSAPFSLLTYAATRQRATQIAAATGARLMPPWRAESAFGSFVGQHPLGDADIETIRRWVAQGAPEGDPKDLPVAPSWTEGWQLGAPDLVVTPSQAYTLQADGADVFRIFVIPIPVDRMRYVRGLEFRPGNPKVVHHANIRIDPARASRRFDDDDPAPGYDGLIAHSAVYPDGHFLGWTPGQVSPLLPKGMAWRLDPDTDLVVELHMQPSGKSETVQPSIGLYFGDDPPERIPAMLRLGRQSIDIPAGEAHYTITDSFRLPVDVEVQAVQPHAHYRAREVTGTATFPDGTSKTLIHIPSWDFRWQHVYRYAVPFTLPRGTTISMRFVFDNSAGNARNPSQPPRRVFWGQRSADEMGDLWVQVLPRNDRDLDTLISQFRPKVLSEDVLGYEREIQARPDSPLLADLHNDVAVLYLGLGRAKEAASHFEVSLRLRPDSAAAHFNFGTALTLAGQLDEAADQYRQALAINPDYTLAHNNLGSILLQRGDTAGAMNHFFDAVRTDPQNAEAHVNLGRVSSQRGERRAAIEHLRRAVQLRPDTAGPIADLAWLLATSPEDALRDPAEAVRDAERAVSLTGRRDANALDVLAAAYASAGEFDRAVQTIDAALGLSPDSVLARVLRQRQALYRQRQPYRQRF